MKVMPARTAQAAGIDETTTMTTRPVTMTSPVGGEPAHAGQGAGQPHLETSGGLLAAQAADGLDRIARDDDGGVELGEGDHPVHGLRTRHPKGLGHGLVAPNRAAGRGPGAAFVASAGVPA